MKNILFEVDRHKNDEPKRIWLSLFTPNMEAFGRIQGVIKDSLEIRRAMKEHDSIQFSVSRIMYTDNATPYLMWGQKHNERFGYKVVDDRTAELINPFFNYCEGDYIVELADGYTYDTAEKSYFAITTAKLSFNDTDIKEIEAYALTKELSKKKLRSYKSEVADVLTTRTLRTILSEVLEDKMNGRWTVGYIDPDVETRYRSFDVTDRSVWEFFLDLQESFRCVLKYDVSFDEDNHRLIQKINAYDLTSYPLCPICGSNDITYNESWLTCQNPACGSAWKKGQVIKITIKKADGSGKADTIILEEDGNSVSADIIGEYGSGEYTDILVTVDDTVLIKDTNYKIDTETKTITLIRTPWRKQIYGHDSGLYITDRNYIKQFEKDSNHLDIVTRYYIYGKDNLSIRNVNPTGQDYIDDIGFYRGYKDEDGWHSKYMSKNLLDELDCYDRQMSYYETNFKKLLKSREELQQKMSDLTIVSPTQRDFLEGIDAELDTTKDYMDKELGLGEALKQAVKDKSDSVTYKGTTYTITEAQDKLAEYHSSVLSQVKVMNDKLDGIYNIDLDNPSGINLDDYSLGSLKESLAVVEERIAAVNEYINSSDNPNSHPDIGLKTYWDKGTKILFEAGYGDDFYGTDKLAGSKTITLTANKSKIDIPWESLWKSRESVAESLNDTSNMTMTEWINKILPVGSVYKQQQGKELISSDEPIRFWVSILNENGSSDTQIFATNYDFDVSAGKIDLLWSKIPSQILYRGKDLYKYKIVIEGLIELKEAEIAKVQDELDKNQSEIDTLRENIQFMGFDRSGDVSEDVKIKYPFYAKDFTDITKREGIDVLGWLDYNDNTTTKYESDSAKLKQDGVSEDDISTLVAYLKYRKGIIREYGYFIREETYNNNDIGTPADATDIEYTQVQQQLYTNGKQAFESVKYPSVSVTLDVVDFEHIIGIPYDRDKLNLGDVVHVKHGSEGGYEYALRVIGISYKPDSHNFNLTFSNNENYQTVGTRVDKMFQAGITSASAITVKSTAWDSAPSTAVDRMQSEFLAKGKALIATTDNAVTIDGKGITVEGEFEANKDSQIRITKNCIALVRENGEVIDTAILPAGIVAKTIIGDLILGKSLRISFPKPIYDSDGNDTGATEEMQFYTDDTGVNISNGSLNIFNDADKSNGVTLNPDEGLVIRTTEKNNRKIEAIFNTEGIKFTNNDSIGLQYTTDKNELIVNGNIWCKNLYLGKNKTDVLRYIDGNGIEKASGANDVNAAISGQYISCTGLKIDGRGGSFEVTENGRVYIENGSITLTGSGGTINIDPDNGILMKDNSDNEVVNLDITNGTGTFKGSLETGEDCYVGSNLRVGYTSDGKWSGTGKITMSSGIGTTNAFGATLSIVDSPSKHLQLVYAGGDFEITGTGMAKANDGIIATRDWVMSWVQKNFQPKSST